MKRVICVLLFMFGLIAGGIIVSAQKKTIHVIPDNAKIYVDGDEVGNGTYTVRFNAKTDFFMLKFECPGYITKQVKLLKTNPNKTIAYKMAKDEFYINSIGPSGNNGGEDAIDVANKWFTVTARKGMTEDQIWKRLMSIVTNNFENVEIRDKSAGWIRTAWTRTFFSSQVARTRLEIKINPDVEDEITYKVKVYSEVNNDIDNLDEEGFEETDRVLKRFVDVINELQNILN